MKPQTPQNPQLALALTKSIGYTENGGAPDIDNPSEGKSGEMASIFQYTPATWKAVAGKYLGNPDAPLNSNDETIATTARVSDWLDQGYTPEQVLSMWNAGPGEPDAYTGKFSDGSSSSGTNKYGVKYSVPSYVKKGMKYLSEFEPEMQQIVTPNKGLTSQNGVTSQVTPNQNPAQQGTDPLTTILSALGSSTPSPSNTSNTQSEPNSITPSTTPQGPQIAGVLAGPKI